MTDNSTDLVQLWVDGKEVIVQSGTTIWEAAKKIGINIPTLCHTPKQNPVGVCRVCTVEIEGARVLQASCVRQCENGMKVKTDSPRVLRARKLLVELLLADHPVPCGKHRASGNCELELLAEELGVIKSRFKEKKNQIWDTSSPVITVDHSACILCDRCIRACNEIQGNEVLGRMNKSFLTRIAFDADSGMGKSTCVSCGECAAACPTGALLDVSLNPENESTISGESSKISSVCPFCGVGCPIDYHVQSGKIVKVTGNDDGHTEGRLCVKGRYGWDYSLNPQRLTVPLIRRQYPRKSFSMFGGIGEGAGVSHHMIDWKDRIHEYFREASWEEALDFAASKFMEIKQKSGSQALAGFGSAKGTNEEAYLFQKLVRQIFGTNNVDHCTRLCHASSVYALIECLGSGAVSNTFQEALETDCVLIIGSNTIENHPVAATYFKQAARRGANLIVMDPRRPGLADHANHFVQFKPGTDVALLNAMMHVIIKGGLIDKRFIADRTENFERLQELVSKYSPEVAEKITGVPKEQIETVSRQYGKAASAMIFWGMGVSQHTTGTDNARCLISLCLLTGNIGRWATGLHPLRGQNNVQGASDVGLIPMFYPGYQNVEDPNVRARFEREWGVQLDAKSGLTVVEIMHEVLCGKISGMFVMGENPVMSDPNMNDVRKAFENLEFLAVQDIFMTETAEFADVIFPASSAAEKEGTYINTNRLIQIGNFAVEPPGQARGDLKILEDLANKMIAISNEKPATRIKPWNYQTPSVVWAEIESLTPLFKGISYDGLKRKPVMWGGGPVIFIDRFPRGKGLFVPVEWAPAQELPDDEFPFILNTGRVLYHWHTGTMTRRTKVLHERSPEPYVEVNPKDLARLKIEPGEIVTVVSRRGKINLPVVPTKKIQSGSLFIPMHFKEAAANLLTIDALDPLGKIPEFKFCSVRLEKAS